MTKKENKTSHLSLQTPGGPPFTVHVLDIQSLVSLTPFVTDLLLKSGEVIPVAGSLIEIVELIQTSAHPVFKNVQIDKKVSKIMNLDEFRRINYEN